MLWDIPSGNPEWKHDHPGIAIDNFLKQHDDFIIDEHFTRMQITSSPRGFLRKLTCEDTEAKMKVLVTGSQSFVGKELMDLCKKNGVECWGLDTVGFHTVQITSKSISAQKNL